MKKIGTGWIKRELEFYRSSAEKYGLEDIYEQNIAALEELLAYREGYDVPALLAEVRRLQAQCENMQALVGERPAPVTWQDSTSEAR